MKQFILNMLTVSLFSMGAGSVLAQPQETRNGHDLPPRGEVKVLFIFAELVGPCQGGNSPNWPAGTVPPNADSYIDYSTSTPNYPTTVLTKYYKDMSLGENDVIGDYYDGIVQVDCADLAGTTPEIAAIQKLNTIWQPNLNGKYVTKHGLTLDEFDDYLYSPAHGTPKFQGVSDNRIDAVVFLWRNHKDWSCSSGLGVGNIFGNSGPMLKNKQVNLYGSWGFCPDKMTQAPFYDGFFVAEYFHALFGGNHFHSGSGASNGTNMFGTSPSFSTTAQSASTSNVACGWDRYQLDWRGGRTHRLSATDPDTGNEVPSDLTTSVNAKEFVLKDFVTVGDAIRIKLPHFDWQSIGDKKNQYLWLENHQMVNQFDVNQNNCESWDPGLFAYIQIGKDEIQGSTIYSMNEAMPSGLKDWLHPKFAEGSWDYYYSYSDKSGANGVHCQWDNSSLPYSTYYPNGSTKMNPFTGYFDGYGLVDSDGNGVIQYHKNSHDQWQPRFQKWTGIPQVGNPPAPSVHGWGDSKDAFTPSSPYQRMSIGTNPSTTPVYTLKEGSNSPQLYDNRSIHLNNLSITILSHDYYNVGNSGPKAIHIRVEWDDSRIENDVRWCGNVVLRNDPQDPGNRTMRIDVEPGYSICLDEGQSPTQLKHNAEGKFVDPTYLHLLDGTVMRLHTNNGIPSSKPSLKVINGSTLHLKSGSRLEIEPGAKIEIDKTSKLCIEPGAIVDFLGGTYPAIFIEDDNGNWNQYHFDYSFVNTTVNGSYRAVNKITVSNSQTNPGTSSLLQAGESIAFYPNTVLKSNAGVSFCARIKTIIDCDDPDIDVYRSSTSSGGTYVQDNSDVISTIDNFEVATLEDPKLTLFPNPAKSELNLKLDGVEKTETGVIQIFDMNGSVLITRNGKDISIGQRIDIGSLSKGIYILRYSDKNHVISSRFIKE